MRANHEHGSSVDVRQLTTKLGGGVLRLSAPFRFADSIPSIVRVAAVGSSEQLILSEVQERLVIVANVGESGVDGSVVVYQPDGVMILTTLEVGSSALCFSGAGDRWQVIKGSSTLLAPGGYSNMTDGVGISGAVGADTFRFRSSDSTIEAAVTDDDPSFGDNVNLRVATAVMDRLADLEADLAALQPVGSEDIADLAVTLSKIQQIAANSVLGNGTAAPASPAEVAIGGGLSMGGGSLIRAALTGDVTAPAGDSLTTLADEVVTSAKMAHFPYGNLVANPSFQTGSGVSVVGSTKNWTSVPVTWTVVPRTGITPQSTAPTAFMLRVPGSITGFTMQAGLTYITEVSPGQPLYIGGWFAADGAVTPDSFKIQVRWLFNTLSGAVSSVSVVPTGTWVRAEARLIAPANAMGVRFEITRSGNADTSNIFATGLFLEKYLTEGRVAALTVFDTKAEAQAAFIDSAVGSIQLLGYTNLGEGGATYKRVGSAPAYPGYFQTADGAFWEICGTKLSPDQFGGLGNGVADDKQACLDLLLNLKARGGGCFYWNKFYDLFTGIDLQISGTGSSSERYTMIGDGVYTGGYRKRASNIGIRLTSTSNRVMFYGANFSVIPKVAPILGETANGLDLDWQYGANSNFQVILFNVNFLPIQPDTFYHLRCCKIRAKRPRVFLCNMCGGDDSGVGGAVLAEWGLNLSESYQPEVMWNRFGGSKYGVYKHDVTATEGAFFWKNKVVGATYGFYIERETGQEPGLYILENHINATLNAAYIDGVTDGEIAFNLVHNAHGTEFTWGQSGNVITVNSGPRPHYLTALNVLGSPTNVNLTFAGGRSGTYIQSGTTTVTIDTGGVNHGYVVGNVVSHDFTKTGGADAAPGDANYTVATVISPTQYTVIFSPARNSSGTVLIRPKQGNFAVASIIDAYNYTVLEDPVNPVSATVAAGSSVVENSSDRATDDWLLANASDLQIHNNTYRTSVSMMRRHVRFDHTRSIHASASVVDNEVYAERLTAVSSLSPYYLVAKGAYPTGTSSNQITLPMRIPTAGNYPFALVEDYAIQTVITRPSVEWHVTPSPIIGNTPATETTLASITIPRKIMAYSGRMCEIEATGTFAANAGSKKVKAKFGGQLVFDATLTTNAGDWSLRAKVFMTTAANAEKSSGQLAATNETNPKTHVNPSFNVNTNTGDQDVIITGEGPLASDVLCSMLQVRVL